MRKDSKRATNLFSPLQVHIVNCSVFSLTLSISSFIHWVPVLHFMKVVHWPFPIMSSQQLLPRFTSLLKSIQNNCGWLSLTLGAWWPIFSVTETSSITLSLVVGKWQLCPIMTRSLLLLLLPAWMTPFTTSPTHFKAACKGGAWNLAEASLEVLIKLWMDGWEYQLLDESIHRKITLPSPLLPLGDYFLTAKTAKYSSVHNNSPHEISKLWKNWIKNNRGTFPSKANSILMKRNDSNLKKSTIQLVAAKRFACHGGGLHPTGSTFHYKVLRPPTSNGHFSLLREPANKVTSNKNRLRCYEKVLTLLHMYENQHKRDPR